MGAQRILMSQMSMWVFPAGEQDREKVAEEVAAGF